MDGASVALVVAGVSLLSVIVNGFFTRSNTSKITNLQNNNEKEVLELKTTINRTVDLYAAANTSFTEGQKAAMEKKLDAIGKLWSQVLELRRSLPPILMIIDVMTVEEYAKVKDNADLQPLRGDLSQEKLASLVNNEDGPIEKVRPYVRERMWALYHCYQLLTIHMLVSLNIGNDATSQIEWYKNEGTRKLIEAVLNPDELRMFDQLSFGKWSNVQQLLESKILTASQRVISGEEFGKESFEQTLLIQRRVTDLQQQIDKDKVNVTS